MPQKYTLSYPEITSNHCNGKMVVEKLLNDGREEWYITQILQSSGYGIIDGYTSLLESIDTDIDGDDKNVFSPASSDFTRFFNTQDSRLISINSGEI